MSAENNPDDGYFLHKALWDLSHVATSKGDGWSYIREFWEALANGSVDERDAALWAREIAKRVVYGVLAAPPQERPKRTMAALGFVGPERGHRRERDHVEMSEEFRVLAEANGRRRGTSRRQFAQGMLDRGYFEGLSVEQAMKAIDYVKSEKLPKK